MNCGYEILGHRTRGDLHQRHRVRYESQRAPQEQGLHENLVHSARY
jgi:hypothetical protein